MDYGSVLSDGPDVLSLVGRARAAGVATALLSDARAVPEKCAALFDVVVLAGTLGVRKPAPEAFRRVHHTDPATTVSDVEILLGLPAG